MKGVSISSIAVLITCLCMLSTVSFAESDADEKADAFFAEKQYAEALNIWYGAVSSGQASAGLYYNIGLAESQLNHTPEAMLAFEKAGRLKPMNAAITAAISEERKKIQNGTIPVDSFFLKEWYRWMVTLLRPGYWVFIGLIILLLAVFNSIFSLQGKRDRTWITKRFQIYLVISGCCFVVLGILVYREIYRDDEAILRSVCTLRQGAAEDSPAGRTLFPGEKIKITDQIGAWYNVRLLNLDEGWMKKDCLVQIRLEE